ncbi:MAG TPA: Glu-tRNA(Gln) amidotransferase GatDE subunit E [Bacteroidales bacterium]|nr:Glu-tRNA(Gln) amidotransferase GatDE subunit E [Bacteroidales bacterium]
MSKQRFQNQENNKSTLHFTFSAIDAKANYEETRQQVGYVNRRQATQEDYDRIGFKSGLEVHQQLLTDKKLFCNCPAGLYHADDDYDAEVIRHMRPTLSELGEYDGTALMEFKTRKNIIYRIKYDSACTYEVDDTPPFPLNRQALRIAIEIALLSKLNIVGEVHITRKQYLDGSIPTGFQRTAIVGVEGEIPLRHKKVRLIQLSVEEDACREISDIGHFRTFKTDRLGMPLIETVTYPDCLNPDEVMEACNYIRFLNRSTGYVRTGSGSGREDVNVSCRGGHRVEIKGVSHTRWIPELTHNEAFRQWALLLIRDKLQSRIRKENWRMTYKRLNFFDFHFNLPALIYARDNRYRIVAVNLPQFRGILSHFTQPEHCFANEISDRLKVIACIEKPNMTHSEAFVQEINEEDWSKICQILQAEENDAQIVFWGPEDDISTALETIEERCLMAFDGVPPETRKSFEDGTTIFERVLPGADRMYPDTDSAPIPLTDDYIEEIRKDLPTEVMVRYNQLIQWNVPQDTFTYIFKKNLYPLIERIYTELEIPARFTGSFLGHTVKYIEGQKGPSSTFQFDRIYDLLKYLKNNHLDLRLAQKMFPEVYDHPGMDFDSVLTILKFKRIAKEDLLSKIDFLSKKFDEIAINPEPENKINWIMGQLQETALGNISMKDLRNLLESLIL